MTNYIILKKQNKLEIISTKLTVIIFHYNILTYYCLFFKELYTVMGKNTQLSYQNCFILSLSLLRKSLIITKVFCHECKSIIKNEIIYNFWWWKWNYIFRNYNFNIYFIFITKNYIFLHNYGIFLIDISYGIKFCSGLKKMFFINNWQKIIVTLKSREHKWLWNFYFYNIVQC